MGAEVVAWQRAHSHGTHRPYWGVRSTSHTANGWQQATDPHCNFSGRVGGAPPILAIVCACVSHPTQAGGHPTRSRARMRDKMKRPPGRRRKGYDLARSAFSRHFSQTSDGLSGSPARGGRGPGGKGTVQPFMHSTTVVLGWSAVLVWSWTTCQQRVKCVSLLGGLASIYGVWRYLGLDQ